MCCFRFHIFFLFFLLLLPSFAFFFRFSQTQWHISIDVVVFESSSSSPFQVFVFFLCCHRGCLFLCLIHDGKSPSTFFELVPADSFTCASVASLNFLCRCVHLTTRSLCFVPANSSLLPTAHCRCDEFFDCHFSIRSSTSGSVLVLDTLERPTLTVFTTI